MEEALAIPARALCAASLKFGSRMEPHVESFRNCLHFAAEITSSPAPTAALCAPLDDQIGILEDVLDITPPSNILFHHTTVVCIAAASFSCILARNPVKQLDHFADEVEKSNTALRHLHDASHGELADAVESVFRALNGYIKANVRTGVTIKDASGMQIEASTAFSSASSSANLSLDTVPHLIEYRTGECKEAIAELETCAKTLGGKALEQTKIFVSAMQSIYYFLVAASTVPEPSSEDKKQEMLKPVYEHVTRANAIAAEAVKADPHFNHVKALDKALNLVHWVSAQENPAKCVADADQSAYCHIYKIHLTKKRSDDYPAHKSFVNALKEVFAVMSSYVKKHHADGVCYGACAPKGGFKEEATNGGDNTVLAAADHSEEEDTTYVAAFKEIVKGPLSAYVAASKTLGGDVEKQAASFADAWAAEAEFLAKAARMPKPDDVQTMLAPIADKMGEVAAVAEKVDPRGPFSQHCSAVGESVAALGWVAVEEKATAYVGEMAGAGQFFMDKVKMGAKQTDAPEAHRTWAKSLETLYADLKAYVKEYHTQKLVWNPPKQAYSAARESTDVCAESNDTGADYVSAFRQIISGPLAAFVTASKAIGGDIEAQAVAYAGAWDAEAAFLGKAIGMPEPADIQSMLMPIAKKMGEVSAIAEKADPRGPISNHCSALGESVGALGWVAVSEKATAFVGDMAGAGQFFIDKVKMGAKNTDNPNAHRSWAKALETVFAELKAYVKEYHTQKLVWNPPKAARVPGKAQNDVRSTSNAASSDYVSAFKELISGPLAAYLSTSKALGGEVEQQAQAVASAWEAQATFLAKTIAMAEPDDFQPMLAPIATAMGEVGAFSEKVGPRGAFSHHCTALGECVGALGWVAVDRKATVFVSDAAGAGQFFLDKVKVGAKNTDNPDAHRSWAKSVESLFADLKVYVKEYHTEKLTWKTA